MKITINQKGVQRFQNGHPWIFRSDLLKIDLDQAGVAAVYGPNEKLLGEGLYSPKSLIALRMMTQGGEKITPKLLRTRIEKAFQQRKNLFAPSEIYRLVFGEADHLPSLIIDRYQDVLVFQTLSAGMECFKEDIIHLLKDLFQPRSLIERNDVSVREREGLPTLKQAVEGEAPREVLLELYGKKIGFDPLEGQKTGFFLDQRFNAIVASQYIRGEVLDCFSYVGQFALQAADQAKQVECVDSSTEALEQLKKNAEYNHYTHIQTHCANVFDFLKECDRQKRRFDAVCLDPPAFVKSRSALGQALKGYKEINLRAMRLLRPGGILVTSSCSQNLKAELFEKILLEASRDVKREIQVLERRGQAPDHPWLLSIPETQYLKCYILRVE